VGYLHGLCNYALLQCAHLPHHVLLRCTLHVLRDEQTAKPQRLRQGESRRHLSLGPHYGLPRHCNILLLPSAGRLQRIIHGLAPRLDEHGSRWPGLAI
jgi:hypothetical protein